jgi:hypothetical protein
MPFPKYQSKRQAVVKGRKGAFVNVASPRRIDKEGQ